MNDILQRFEDMTPTSFPAGTALIEEGRQTGKLYVLKSGTLEVRRRGTPVITVTDPGAVVGEMSVLLERPHTASVIALTDVEAYGLDNGMALLEQRPALALHVAVLLAGRLEGTTVLVDRLKGKSEKPREKRLLNRLMGYLTGHAVEKPEAQPRPR